MQARPYQLEAVDAIFRHLAEQRSTMVVMATGLGKSLVAALVVARMPKAWGRALVVVPRRELAKQFYRTFREWFPDIGVDIDMGAEYQAAQSSDMFGAAPRVIIASKDTLYRERRLKRYNPEEFGLMVVDENHGCVPRCSTQSNLMRYFANAKVLGLTATPDRTDGEALGAYFESVAYQYDILQACLDSWLVPIHQRMVHLDDLDLSAVRANQHGDFDPGDLDFVMRRQGVLFPMASAVYQVACKDGARKPTLVFATSVQQAQDLGQILNKYRAGSALALSGEDDMSKRDYELERFRKGEFQFLVNCHIFTTGFDEPSIEIVVPKPTRSRLCYAQCIGRATRPANDCVASLNAASDAEARRQVIASSSKSHMLVLDPHGVSGRHKLITPYDLLGGNFSPEVRKRAEDHSRQRGLGPTKEQLDVIVEMRRLREIMKQQELERQGRIVVHSTFTLEQVDPFDVFDVRCPREPMWLRGRKVTQKQLAFIRQHADHLDPKQTERWGDLSMHQASVLIKKIKEDRDAGAPTERMCATLQKFGIDTSEINFKRAKELLDHLASSGWRREAAQEVLCADNRGESEAE